MFVRGLRSLAATSSRPSPSLPARSASKLLPAHANCGARYQIWQTTYRRTFHQQRPCFRQYYVNQGVPRPRSLLIRWASRPTFYYEVGGIALAVGAFYTYHLEVVPISGRRRFNIMSPEKELEMSQTQFRETVNTYQGQLLPSFHPKTRRVKRVLDRLIPNSGLEGEEWEVFVIESPEQNAFVMPGGKVFVFSGILPICQDDDGLATVLGHEIAHNVAHHVGERLSRTVFLWPLIPISLILTGTDLVAYLIKILGDYAWERPGSRVQESEADHIGLLMMAKSCFDPEKAALFWGRMEKAQQAQIPEFMSTHPSNHNRMEKIQEWMDQAEAIRQESGCAAIGSYARDFRSTLGLGGLAKTSWP